MENRIASFTQIREQILGLGYMAEACKNQRGDGAAAQARVLFEARDTLEALLRVAEAADLDISDAEVNCGRFNKAKDCSPWTDRSLTCSDCPVDWFHHTNEALEQLQERKA